MHRKTIPNPVSSTQLKAHLSEVLDTVARERRTVVVTRHGREIARIVPARRKPERLFGVARGCVTVHGDIVEPIDVEWEALR